MQNRSKPLHAFDRDMRAEQQRTCPRSLWPADESQALCREQESRQPSGQDQFAQSGRVQRLYRGQQHDWRGGTDSLHDHGTPMPQLRLHSIEPGGAQRESDVRTCCTEVR